MEIEKLGQALSQVLEENNRLTIINYHLQEQLDQYQESNSDTELDQSESRVPEKIGKSQMEKFYEDGIHICPVYFGQQIEKDTGCLHCIELITRMEKA